MKRRFKRGSLRCGEARKTGCERIEQAHAVFEMKAVLDEAGRCRCARWSQGQILYARSSKAGHYDYEILLNSQSGVIAPRAGSVTDSRGE